METEEVRDTLKVLEVARDELLDSALTGNIYREHHLDSALAAFEDVKVLWRAQRIIEELFPTEEEVCESESQADSREGVPVERHSPTRRQRLGRLLGGSEKA
jgi:hypothetical protein